MLSPVLFYCWITSSNTPRYYLRLDEDDNAAINWRRLSVSNKTFTYLLTNIYMGNRLTVFT